jgi:hypothetical protein
MTDQERLDLLKLSKKLVQISKEIEVLVIGDCTCKPGYPVCEACVELARVIYGDEIPF